MIRSQFGWVLILVELHVIQHQAYQWLRANGGDKPKMNEFYFVITKARKTKKYFAGDGPASHSCLFN